MSCHAYQYQLHTTSQDFQQRHCPHSINQHSIPDHTNLHTSGGEFIKSTEWGEFARNLPAKLRDNVSCDGELRSSLPDAPSLCNSAIAARSDYPYPIPLSSASGPTDLATPNTHHVRTTRQAEHNILSEYRKAYDKAWLANLGYSKVLQGFWNWRSCKLHTRNLEACQKKNLSRLAHQRDSKSQCGGRNLLNIETLSYNFLSKSLTITLTFLLEKKI
jgi:hypothetical protein